MILHRYLQRELLQAFAATLLLLAAIYLATRAVVYLGDAASGKIAGDVIVGMLLLKLVTASFVIVPLCFFLGVLLGLGRMQQDRELIAMADAGCGPRFLHVRVARIAAACAVLMAALSFVIVPAAERSLGTLEKEAADEADIAGIIPGRFKEYAGGDRVLFVESMTEKQNIMREVFLRVRDRGREGVLKADSARLEDDPERSDRFVVFADGHRYVGEPGQADFSVTAFRRYGVRLSGGTAAAGDQGMGATPTHELWLLGSPHALAELHWRLAMPIAVVVLGALGVALIRTRITDSRFLLLLVGVVVYFLYNNLLAIFRSLIKRESMDAWIGLWPVHLALIAVIVALEFGPRWRPRARRGDPELLTGPL